MSTGVGRDDVLRPVRSTDTDYYVLLAIAVLGILPFAFGYVSQLSEGMIVTGLADWGTGGGVTWGLYIGAFIWWVGIAHGGIILSAAVRLLKMDRYKPVARLAELLTIAALMMAGLYIVFHVGRPDRLVTSVVPAFPSAIHSSPLVWDVTVITLYFVLTATYLCLTLRYDLYRLRDQLPERFDPLYRLLLVGYTPQEDEVVERMVWWLALAIIIMAPLLLHGGVIPWLFALLPTMPGWFGAVQGPQFLTFALTSAIGSILILALAFRRAYGWEELFTDDIFAGLGTWLAFFALISLWLQLQQIITGVFAPTVELDAVTQAKIASPIYWSAILGFTVALAYVFAQALRPSIFTVRRMAAAGALVVASVLVEKTFFVVEGLMYPGFDIYAATPGEYAPSWIELASILATVSLVIVFFLVVVKVIPVVELHALDDHEEVEP